LSPGAYQKGRTAEYHVIETLKTLGATLITRSAGSHGLADITAWLPAKREVLLVQVKTSKKTVSVESLRKEYAKLIELQGPWDAKAVFFIRDKDGWHAPITV
jgi:Holliday junction resolvase